LAVRGDTAPLSTPATAAFSTSGEPVALAYFAEGSTRSGIQTYITLANPQGTAEPVTLDYLVDGGTPISVPLTVPAVSRTTVDVNADVGPERDVSMRIVSISGHGLVVERPVYFSRAIGNAGPVTGGSVEHGETAPRGVWLFAEGSTRAGFQTYLTVQN